MVDGFGAVRLFAHYQYGLSQLAVCDPGFDCRPFLRLDVAKDEFDICFGHCAWAGRYDLAFLFPDFLIRQNLKTRRQDASATRSAGLSPPLRIPSPPVF